MEINKILDKTIEQGTETIEVNKRISNTILKILDKLDAICNHLK